jgi:hypothetical protein
MAQQNNPERRKQYWLGLGLGFIPLIAFLIFYGLALRSPSSLSSPFTSGVIIAFVVWVIELFVVIGFLASSRVRFVGYGLLTAFLVTPIVTAVACNALPHIIHA